MRGRKRPSLTLRDIAVHPAIVEVKDSVAAQIPPPPPSDDRAVSFWWIDYQPHQLCVLPVAENHHSWLRAARDP